MFFCNPDEKTFSFNIFSQTLYFVSWKQQVRASPSQERPEQLIAALLTVVKTQKTLVSHGGT